MIEPMVEAEPAPLAPGAGRRGRAFVAGLTVLAVVAGGVAVARHGARTEGRPLALMAGNGRSAGGSEQSMAAPAYAPVPGGTADSKLGMPYPSGWGLKFEVDGALPELPDHAPAWRVSGPALDRAAVARIGTALGLTGAPALRDGAWFVEDGDWTLTALGGGDTWSVSLYRSRYLGLPDDAATTDDSPTGPALSAAEAEGRVRDLLDRMGVPANSWSFQTTETQVSMGWACAAPAPAVSPEELTKLEADKIAQLDPTPNAANAPAAAGAAGATVPVPADKPLPGGGVSSCPPPPPPTKGYNVAAYPLLDGHRADWAVWNATLRSDGRVENLYGSWATFERAGNYKLRGVDTALKELQSPTSPPVPYAIDLPAVATEPAPSIEPAAAASSGPGGAATGGATAPVPGRLPQADPPAPQVVTITGVELGLMQASVFEDGRVRLTLVPAYRFTGHFDNGTPWETSTLALHPDAIAPPPDFPIPGDVRSGGSGGGVTGSGKAVPPVAPAVGRD